MAETADEHVRISAETKERLRQRKREGESFNDTISRLLNDDRDLLAGFGTAEERAGDTLAETVTHRKEKSHHRIDRMTDRRVEDDTA
jgi:predicted CopG family antitoxin